MRSASDDSYVADREVVFPSEVRAEVFVFDPADLLMLTLHLMLIVSFFLSSLSFSFFPVLFLGKSGNHSAQ
jgi:hypothetical protein